MKMPAPRGTFRGAKSPPQDPLWVPQPGPASQLNLGAAPRNPTGAAPSPGTSRRHHPHPHSPPEPGRAKGTSGMIRVPPTPALALARGSPRQTPGQPWPRHVLFPVGQEEEGERVCALQDPHLFNAMLKSLFGQ